MALFTGITPDKFDEMFDLKTDDEGTLLRVKDYTEEDTAKLFFQYNNGIYSFDIASKYDILDIADDTFLSEEHEGGSYFSPNYFNVDEKAEFVIELLITDPMELIHQSLDSFRQMIENQIGVDTSIGIEIIEFDTRWKNIELQQEAIIEVSVTEWTQEDLNQLI